MAVSADQRSAALGWCQTKLDADGDEIELGCVTTRTAPACITITLENPGSGERNPPVGSCDPDYTPFAAHVYPDALSQFAFEIPFRDRRGLTTYPVDGEQIGDARLLVQTYRPAAHFTRRLLIPEIRVGEWVAKK
jgi:hypothetical protein